MEYLKPVLETLKQKKERLTKESEEAFIRQVEEDCKLKD